MERKTGISENIFFPFKAEGKRKGNPAKALHSVPALCAQLPREIPSYPENPLQDSVLCRGWDTLHQGWKLPHYAEQTMRVKRGGNQKFPYTF